MRTLWATLLIGCRPTAPEPADDAIVAAFMEMHRDVHAVVELGLDRDAVHDRLAAAFAGEHLTDQYLEHWATLRQLAEDDAGIDVLRVDYERVEVLDRAGDRVRVDADWAVGGIVRHRQHRHPRTNRYRAIYTLAPTPDGLRIVDTRMRNLRRVASGAPQTGWPLDGLPTTPAGLLDPGDYLDGGLGR